MISGRASDDSAGDGGGWKRGHFVVGTTNFEGKDRLGVLAFEKDGVVE